MGTFGTCYSYLASRLLASTLTQNKSPEQHRYSGLFKLNQLNLIISLHVKHAYDPIPLGTSYGYGCFQVLLLLARRHR